MRNYMKGHGVSAVFAPFFKVLEAAFELTIPLLVKNIIDIGIANGDKPYIYKMCALMVFFAIVGFSCTMLAQYFAARASCGYCANLREALFNHIQKLSFTDIDKIGPSTLIGRLTNDTMQIQTGLNLALRLICRSPAIVFGSMIMAFTIDVKAALIFVVAIPLLAAVVFGIMLGTVPLYKKIQAALDHTLSQTRENLAGTRVIRAFGNEEAEIKNFEASTDKLNIVQKAAGGISALMNPITYLVVNLAIIVLIQVGAMRVDGGLITQGAVIALYNYMSQILVELIKFANLIITMTKAKACSDRVKSVLEIPSADKTESTAKEMDSDIAVDFQDVSFTYAGASSPSLSHLTFTVKKGETVGIIGGTGSGKTSLVHLLPRFYQATDGKITLFGNDISAYSDAEIREKVGIVMQKSVLFQGTVRDNMKWGKKDATDEEIMDALQIAQALDIVDKKGGLDSGIAQDGKNLSGGQKQRLNIARTVLMHPDILIFDDSSSALDYATDAGLRKAIRKMDASQTVFIVSQRAASVMHADKILVMEDGKIVDAGTHDELLMKSEIYREIYDSQFRGQEVTA